MDLLFLLWPILTILSPQIDLSPKIDLSQKDIPFQKANFHIQQASFHLQIEIFNVDFIKFPLAKQCALPGKPQRGAAKLGYPVWQTLQNPVQGRPPEGTLF